MKNLESLQPIEWTEENDVRFLRQDLLPHIIEYNTTDNYQILCQAIKKLYVRGAPVIGVAGAMAAALASLEVQEEDFDNYYAKMSQIIKEIVAVRPTANNLSYALLRISRVLRTSRTIRQIREGFLKEALKIAKQEELSCDKIAKNGAPVLPQGVVMTHCNAGGLACMGCGTALGVIEEAYRQGKIKEVIVNETRPLLQGARLTTLELRQKNIPYRLITDNMAAAVINKGMVQSIIVGADRIARNGDTANKIGTYNLAILAHAHSIPFYVAAPLSTIDLAAESEDDIIIELREDEEVTSFNGQSVAPENTASYNPAFDVTPAHLISAIITEKEIYYQPYNF